MHSFRRVKTMAALAVALGSLLGWDHASATSAPIRADTFVSSVTKNQNYGSSPLLSVSPTSITFLLFDLTALPPGVSDVDIEKANVLIEIANVTAIGTVAVFPVLTNWSESGITFNNAPALGTAPIVTLPVTSPSTAQIVAVDVTAQVRNWLKNPGGMTNFGIALVSIGAPPTASLFLTSKEGINAPILDVTLMDQGPAGPAGPQGLKGDPGAVGATGPQGAQGPRGPQGDPGPIGPTGAAGPIGPFGPAGVIGPAGLVGPIGPAGPVGSAGPVGPQGPQGTVGSQGTPGPTGPQGPIGPAGVTGQYSTTQHLAAGGVFSANDPPGWNNVTLPVTVHGSPTAAWDLLLTYKIPIAMLNDSSCAVMTRAVVDGVAREPTWTFVSNVAPFFAIASQTIAVSGFLAGTSTTVQIQVALIDDPCTIYPGATVGGNGFVTFEAYPTLVTTVINH